MNSSRLESLWRFYEEHAAQARQHEDQRERMTGVLVAVAAIFVGFLTAQKSPSEFQIVASLMLIVLGVFGFFFSLKHYERNRMHTTIMGEIRGEIDKEISGNSAPKTLKKIRKDGERKHDKGFNLGKSNKGDHNNDQNEQKQQESKHWLTGHRTYKYWATIPVLITIFGGVCFLVALVNLLS